MFFASTSEVYAGGVDAGPVEVPTAEPAPVMIADLTAPRFAYAISKLLGEAGFIHGGRARGFRAVVGRFHNVYGPRMGADHVIPEMTLRALGGEDPFRVPGAEQYRAFCYVEDAVDATLRLMAAPAAAGQIVHIGAAHPPEYAGDVRSRYRSPTKPSSSVAAASSPLARSAASAVW